MFPERSNVLRQSAPACDRVIDEQHDDRAHDGDEHRINVEAGYSGAADFGEDEAADEGAHDPENDVQDAALAALVNDTTRHKSGNQIL